MLRITVDREETLCRLKLAGKLFGPWVTEAELAWRSSACRGDNMEVDLRELTGIDDNGRELLSNIYRAGARLVVEGVWLKALIEEITEDQEIDGTLGRN